MLAGAAFVALSVPLFLALLRYVDRVRAPWSYVWTVGAVLAAVPAALAVGRLSHWGAFRARDEDLYRVIGNVDTDLLTRMSQSATGIGDITPSGFVAILTGLLLGYHFRSVRLLLVPIGAYLVSLRAQRLIDAIDNRPRPGPDLAVGAVGGFPSGGTVRVIVVVGVIAVAVVQVWRTRRDAIVVGAVLGAFVWVEIASRAVLGRHWPLDLVGGVVAGLLLLIAAAPLMRLPDASRPKHRPAQG